YMSVLSSFFFSFFFFQAEDGIRDFHVTGVQTCALPILEPPMRIRSGEAANACSKARIPAWMAGSSGEQIQGAPPCPRRTSTVTLGWARSAKALATKSERDGGRDRKSTRLNSSHVKISYAVFCLKK